MTTLSQAYRAGQEAAFKKFAALVPNAVSRMGGTSILHDPKGLLRTGGGKTPPPPPAAAFKARGGGPVATQTLHDPHGLLGKSAGINPLLLGAGVGAAGGLLTGGEDHKLRNMMLGAGLGAGGGALAGRFMPGAAAAAIPPYLHGA